MKRIWLGLVPFFIFSCMAKPDIRVLDERFMGEGACAADIDGDGVQDVVSGAIWYRGPDRPVSLFA